MSTEMHEEPKNPPKAEKKSNHKLKKFFTKLVATKKRRIITGAVAIAVVLGVLFTVPYTRYAIAGTFIKKDATITVTDSVSGKPVSEVLVSLGKQTVKTNANGEAKLKSVPVGNYNLKIEKKYYQGTQQSLSVPILIGVPVAKFTVRATGRAVSIKVTNKVSGIPLEKAKVSASDTTAVTDKNGEASIVLPIRTKIQKAKVEAEGFNAVDIELTVTSADNQKVDTALVPVGKIYYLSKRTGKLNVVKSNLDGTDQQVVVEGTGREDDGQTILLAARNWKYLALLARRDSDKPKLYLLDSSTDKLSVMDEGEASFQLIGWSSNKFIYLVNRNTPNYWDDKRVALKSFDVAAQKVTTIDETTGSGTSGWDSSYENINAVSILDDEVIYTKTWTFSQRFVNDSVLEAVLGDKRMSVISTKPSGENRHVVRDFPARNGSSIDGRLYEPNEAYYRVSDGKGAVDYYEYSNGKLTANKSVKDESFYASFYKTYIVSPSGTSTFWYEPRDGKNTLLIGNNDGEDSKEIASFSEYTPYGWFGDEYLLISKSGSELYVMSRNNPKSSPVKVSDYHKPQFTYPGYGYGYGGQ